MDLIIAFLRWLFENDSAEEWMRDEGYLPPTPAQGRRKYGSGRRIRIDSFIFLPFWCIIIQTQI
jgi:hypothetical protein